HLSVTLTPPYTSILLSHHFLLFFFNAPPPPQLYTLSLHDALPISRPYVEAKPRSPRVFPGLEIASRDRIREIAAEAREAPLRRRHPLSLLPLRGDNRRDRRRYWVRRVRQRSSCASTAFAHQGRPGEHSVSEGCLRPSSPRPAVRTACAFLPSRR